MIELLIIRTLKIIRLYCSILIVKILSNKNALGSKRRIINIVEPSTVYIVFNTIKRLSDAPEHALLFLYYKMVSTIDSLTLK